MGDIYTPLKVYSRDKQSFEDLSIIVDTGSIYTW